MTTTFYSIRRTIAQRMNLWSGAPDGTGPATFTSTDSQGSLSVLYDNTRPDPDQDLNGAWICINPGGSGNSSLATIWRQLTIDTGFSQPGGVMTLSSPVPSAAYAAVGMTYEIYKTFAPQQWLLAANWALSHAYPEIYRNVWFEVPEDPPTVFYDWQNLARNIAVLDPGSAPVASAVAVPNPVIPVMNMFQPGTYQVAISYVGPAGESKASPTTAVTIANGQGIQFNSFSCPEGTLEVRYYASTIPGGTVLAQMNLGQAMLPAGVPDSSRPGIVQPDGTVPAVIFGAAPPKVGRAPSSWNQTGLSILDLKSIRRRINPGRFPEMFLNVTTDSYEEEGGGIVRLLFLPLYGMNLRFECVAAPRQFNSETDTTDVPEEIIYSGAEQYLWELVAKSASSQNAQIWKAEADLAGKQYIQAKATYRMPQKARKMRRPRISVIY